MGQDFIDIPEVDPERVKLLTKGEGSPAAQRLTAGALVLLDRAHEAKTFEAFVIAQNALRRAARKHRDSGNALGFNAHMQLCIDLRMRT